MRDELERVLAYPHIVSRMDFYRVDAAQVLAAFDAQARLVGLPPRGLRVQDADDQKFIDLAAAHRAILLSKGQGRDLHAQAALDAGCPRGHRAGAGRKPGRSRCLKAAAAVGPRRLCSEPFLYSSKLKSAAATGCQAPSPLSCSTCVVPQHGGAVGNAHQRHARGPQAFIQRCLVGAVQRARGLVQDDDAGRAGQDPAQTPGAAARRWTAAFPSRATH